MYLHHLDGVRTIAVVGVICFHFDIPPFRGGDTGVDVFFVLSAFLMTRIITSAILNNQFSLLSFAERRFWRLYPSVVATAFLAIFLSFVGGDHLILRNTTKSALFVLLSCSNFSFYSESGYFDSSSLTKPLLHTWSLAVEEQFYLIWPLFLVLIYKITHSSYHVAAVCLCVGLISLAASFSITDADLRFFMLPFRMFEFVIGALSYFIFPVTKNLGVWLQSLGAAIGLALVSVSYVSAPAGAVVKTFPSSTYYFATFGSALLVLLPNSFGLGYILSSAGTSHIGKMSYSLYLTHWVVKVFVDLFLLRYSGVGTNSRRALYILVTLPLSYALHALVEVPLRHSKTRPTRALALSVIVCTLFSVAGFQLSNEIGVLRENLLLGNGAERKTSCDASAAGLLSESVVIGTSFGDHIQPPYGTLYCQNMRYNLTGVLTGVMGCPLYMKDPSWLINLPLKELNVGWDKDRKLDRRNRCVDVNNARWKLLEELAAANKSVVVVNSHRWEVMFQSQLSISSGSMHRYVKEVVRDLGKLGFPVLFGTNFPRLLLCDFFDLSQASSASPAQVKRLLTTRPHFSYHTSSDIFHSWNDTWAILDVEDLVLLRIVQQIFLLSFWETQLKTELCQLCNENCFRRT